MGYYFIYLSTSCSETRFKELQTKRINRDVPQAQKYHRLLIEGLSKNYDCKVCAMTVIPTNRTWCKKLYFARKEECISKELNYVYLPFVNMPVIKQIFLSLQIKKEIHKAIKNCHNDKIVFVCDIWNQTLSRCARNIGKKTGIKVIGIVTDVPKHRSNAYKSKGLNIKTVLKDFVENQTYKNASKYDFYLLLTLAMNDIVNPNNKPYVVLEGHSDVRMRDIKNEIELKKHPKIILYAGTLHREYGIRMLVNAFVKGNFKDWELHIYGKGNFENEMVSIMETHLNVKYFGLASNEYIVKEQLLASLVVNPRPTNEDYVKYSFPSKTLEAMASGTPLLTTRLPGMPKEYLDYVYIMNDETEEGYLNTLTDILNKSQFELHEKGNRAKQFALSQKNNVTQAQKVIDLLKYNN